MGRRAQEGDHEVIRGGIDADALNLIVWGRLMSIF